MSENDHTSASPKLLSPRHVADLLGIRPQSLRVRRMRGAGPPFIRLGNGPTSRCAYRAEEVVRWISERPSYLGTLEEKAALRTNGGTPGVLGTNPLGVPRRTARTRAAEKRAAGAAT